jgi:myo-inositol-1-phosphate synthase
MINVAIVGLGNCAKSLIEGIQYYTDNKKQSSGLMKETIGGYNLCDINVKCAFDIDVRKIKKRIEKVVKIDTR